MMQATATTALLLLSTAAYCGAQPWQDEAVQTCAGLNLTQKLTLMRGYGKIDGYSRNSGCAGKCGRDTFRWDNGPQGFGDGSPPGSSTQWPSCLNMGATFDTTLASEWGIAMGKEFWDKGTNIQEGPGLNVARVMKNGRNFEYMSGESGTLGAVLARPLIAGIQKHVMSIAKHYIGNTQETKRTSVNEVIDEVTMMELYAVPFAAAAEHASGFMRVCRIQQNSASTHTDHSTSATLAVNNTTDGQTRTKQVRV